MASSGVISSFTRISIISCLEYTTFKESVSSPMIASSNPSANNRDSSGTNSRSCSLLFMILLKELFC